MSRDRVSGEMSTGFADEQKEHLAETNTTVILEHFDGTHEGSISIAPEPVAESDWNETVVPDIERTGIC